MSTENTCRCGAKIDLGVPSIPGQHHIVADVDGLAIIDLFQGKLDYEVCLAGCKQDTPSNLIFLNSLDEELLIVPRRMTDAPELQRNLSRILPSPLYRHPLRVLAGSDQLREGVLSLLDRRVEWALRAVRFDPVPQVDQDYVFKNFRKLPPPVTNALNTFITGLIPNRQLRIITTDGAEAESMSSVDQNAIGTYIGRALQAFIWIALVYHYSSVGPSGSLEEDLCLFVDAQLQVSGARQLFNKCAELFEDEATGCNLYVLEAIRASLYMNDIQANPRSDAWAATYLAIETAFIQAPDVPAFSNFRYQRISPERAKKLLACAT